MASTGAGEGAIVVPVEVPIAVRRLRDRMDPSAAVGVPAHVTLLYPFMPPDALNDDVRGTIERIVRGEPAFRVTFGRVGRWPNIVYLEPEPGDPFKRLIAALSAAFPDYPPYGGVHETVVPHLTIADDPRPAYVAAAEHALPPMLPIRDVVREAWLMGHTAGETWHTLSLFPLGPVAAGR